MNWLEHPRIYLFSAVLVPINVVALSVCVNSGNTQGTVLNAFFLVLNTFGFIGNLLLRRHRVKMAEDKKMERRNELIRLTIGE